jgi:alginate O-acetyltransferase complex protein AlgI
MFNSTEYGIFFVSVMALFWSCYKNRTAQNLVILVASQIFYSFFHYSFVIYLAAMITVTYGASILIQRTEDEGPRRMLQYLSVFVLCFGLIYLKYSGLIIGNIQGLSQWQASALHLLVPVGISFYTFSCIGYVLDVYRGKIEAEYNPISFAAYISFFPYLLIGPIPAARTVLPQFRKKPSLTLDALDQSIGEILWGLFKKIVVADNISLGVNYCFAHQSELQGSSLLLGVILFYFYLYADFSGYSDMARGFARLLGIDIVRNFNSPFTATSITEFWRKWHISLTNWFYEYVFNPIVIAFRNLGSYSIALAILFTFGLSGIWHGADWKFGVWGLLHALAMIYEYYTADTREKIGSKLPLFVRNFIGIFFTLGYAILAETFFRANSIQEGIEINRKILSAGLFTAPVSFGTRYLKWCVPLLVVEILQRKGPYYMDLEQWGLKKALGKLWPNPIHVKTINIFIKVLLYLILCYCTWLFYKRMNMAEYYYFKF